MEINENVINEMAKELRAGKMAEYQLEIQEKNIEVKKIIEEIAKENPEASREEVLKMANDRVTELVTERETNKAQENQETRD